MKTYKIIIPALSFVLISACGGPPRDPESRLARLQAQKEALTAQIEQLQAEIVQQGTETPQAAPAFIHGLKIQPSVFQHFIQAQANVVSDNNIMIPAQSNGIVKKIHVREGQNVSQGQLLAELDGAILESGIDELEHSLQLVTTIYERQDRLWKKNIGSEIEYLQAKNNKESLEKKLATLKEQYKLTQIHAPISGTVDDVQIKEGEMAAAGYGTIRIVQLSRLKIHASLSENYISLVKIGAPVQVQIPVASRTMDLKINAVSQVIDPNNRTFQIEILIPSREKDLKPNMLAVVTINDYTNPEALTVPNNIVLETGTEKFLFVAEKQNDGWIARRRTITTGESYAEKIEILSGLKAGDMVVSYGFQNLTDGQPVSIQPEQ